MALLVCTTLASLASLVIYGLNREKIASGVLFIGHVSRGCRSYGCTLVVRLITRRANGNATPPAQLAPEPHPILGVQDSTAVPYLFIFHLSFMIR